VTDSISIFFTVLGVVGITVGTAFAAYFSSTYVPYLATRITDPVATTSLAALIGLFVSCIYLSLIDVSAQAIIQCYLIDLSN
jgi:uncharacterized membrane protein required for colicin V production